MNERRADCDYALTDFQTALDDDHVFSQLVVDRRNGTRLGVALNNDTGRPVEVSSSRCRELLRVDEPQHGPHDTATLDSLPIHRRNRDPAGRLRRAGLRRFRKLQDHRHGIAICRDGFHNDSFERAFTLSRTCSLNIAPRLLEESHSPD